MCRENINSEVADLRANGELTDRPAENIANDADVLNFHGWLFPSVTRERALKHGNLLWEQPLVANNSRRAYVKLAVLQLKVVYFPVELDRVYGQVFDVNELADRRPRNGRTKVDATDLG